MTDFPVHANDVHIYSQNTTYAVARSTSLGYSNDPNLDVGQWKNGLNFLCLRPFLAFNTSATPDDATITQVNLKLVCIVDNSDTDFDVQIIKQDWSAWFGDLANATKREAAWDACLAGTADASIWRNTSGMSINTAYTSGNLATDWVNKTGYTYYSLLSSRDKGANEPSGKEYISIASGNNTTEAYRPVLTVTYTEAGTLLKVNFNAQMQNLAGGF